MTRDELVTVMARAIWNTSQHFMTWEETSLYFANDVADNPVEETLGEARAALDALDALGMGPKRVVELEKEVDRLQEGWQTATKMLERGDVNGATHVLSTGMVPSNYHAALKGQSND